MAVLAQECQAVQTFNNPLNLQISFYVKVNVTKKNKEIWKIYDVSPVKTQKTMQFANKSVTHCLTPTLNLLNQATQWPLPLELFKHDIKQIMATY